MFDYFVGLAFKELKPLKTLVASTFIFLVFARDSSSTVWDSIVLGSFVKISTPHDCPAEGGKRIQKKLIRFDYTRKAITHGLKKVNVD